VRISLLPLILQLEEVCHVTFEASKAQERNEFHHYDFLEVDLNAEGTAVVLFADHFAFLVEKGVLGVQVDDYWELVGVVVQVDKAVVEEEARVAFFAIGVVDLLAPLDVVSCFDDEAFTLITVGPLGPLWSLMVQHVSVRYEAIGLDAFDRDSEDTTADHHAHFTVLFKRELAEVRHLGSDQVVVFLDVADFVCNYVLHGAAFEPLSFLCCVEDWEVCKALGQDIDEALEVGIWLTLLFHQKAG
jgi:hypothetical protein